MNKFKSLLLLVPVLALGACSGMKETLGLERTSPDEFAVVERAPLTLPPNYDLVPPQPGTARPQETSPTAAAQGLVLGSQSSAPKAGAASKSSSAESLLLQKANAAQVDSNIRQQLAQPEPGEENTVAQKLGISPPDSGKALDPAKEAQDLKKKNIKTVPVTVTPAKNAQ